ncbi:hypothetical protein GCM10010358_15560 [Streptomyces minutiscleroticus]|uniref:Uncharacterized protein n=1 Tax=Streptomyces minutiscleroticus TaxID=68238 RepID=A0A918NCD7_9ACTN|nr:hypothetical protein GCM10010358_15560 [Streptomyces minutiscleroticus]
MQFVKAPHALTGSAAVTCGPARPSATRAAGGTTKITILVVTGTARQPPPDPRNAEERPPGWVIALQCVGVTALQERRVRLCRVRTDP